METSVAKPAVPAAADLAGLEPIDRIRKRWPMILGAVLTLLMVAALARELFDSGIPGLKRAIPVNPLFYLAFAVYYFAPPTFDYLIFRRLWAIPIAGMVALHKKRIANEVLFGYSGEAYFYAWARQRTQMVAAPFGAVKDVMIQSAMAGNSFTLLLILLVAPFAASLHQSEVNPTTIAVSALLMVLMCLPFFIFSRRVFSLPGKSLWWVFGMQMARLSVVTMSIALAWHFAMPAVSIGTWIFLAAVRMLASRLPFVPNKELIFASFAIVLIGSGQAVTDLLALGAGLTLLLHVVLMAVFGADSLIRRLA